MNKVKHTIIELGNVIVKITRNEYGVTIEPYRRSYLPVFVGQSTDSLCIPTDKIKAVMEAMKESEDAAQQD